MDINHIELISGSVIAMIGIMFMLIHVQMEEDWSQFRKMRIILAISYFLLSASNLYHGITNASVDTSELSTALSLIIGSFQALLFTAHIWFLWRSTANEYELVGVADKNNFHKHFRKITGLTPTEYKAQFEKPE